MPFSALEQRFAHCLQAPRERTPVSYAANRAEPLLRLYRYKEAFSAALVESLLDRFAIKGSDFVLDPFAGMGTTLLVCMRRGIPSVGIERLPSSATVARSWPRFLDLEPGDLTKAWLEYREHLLRVAPAPFADDVPLLKRALSTQTLDTLRRWKTIVASLPEPLHSVFTVLTLGALPLVSRLSNDGQFPRIVSDRNVLPLPDALLRKVELAEEDVLCVRSWRNMAVAPLVIDGDARSDSLPAGIRPAAIITSPPYPNRFDYTRSYCLDLLFLGVGSRRELRALRHSLLRSHIESRGGDDSRLPYLDQALSIMSANGFNNPRVPSMLRAYFADMRTVIAKWYDWLKPGGNAAVVIGNVRFAGVVVPVDLLLCEIAEQRGFRVRGVQVLRYKGNSSQQMKEYGRVPVRESLLLWEKP